MTEVILEPAFYNTTSIRPLLFSQNIEDNTAHIEGQEIVDEERNLTDSSAAAACNESVYFICPDPNPLFKACVSITLQSEFQVNIRIILEY